MTASPIAKGTRRQAESRAWVLDLAAQAEALADEAEALAVQAERLRDARDWRAAYVARLVAERVDGAAAGLAHNAETDDDLAVGSIVWPEAEARRLIGLVAAPVGRAHAAWFRAHDAAPEPELAEALWLATDDELTAGMAPTMALCRGRIEIERARRDNLSGHAAMAEARARCEARAVLEAPGRRPWDTCGRP